MSEVDAQKPRATSQIYRNPYSREADLDAQMQAEAAARAEADALDAELAAIADHTFDQDPAIAEIREQIRGYTDELKAITKAKIRIEGRADVRARLDSLDGEIVALRASVPALERQAVEQGDLAMNEAIAARRRLGELEALQQAMASGWAQFLAGTPDVSAKHVAELEASRLEAEGRLARTLRRLKIASLGKRPNRLEQLRRMGGIDVESVARHQASKNTAGSKRAAAREQALNAGIIPG